MILLLLVLQGAALSSVTGRAELGGTTDDGISAQSYYGYQWSDGVTPEVSVGVLTGSQDHSPINLEYSVVTVAAGFRFVIWPDRLISPVVAAHLGAGFPSTDSRSWRAGEPDYAGDLEIAADVRLYRPFYLSAFVRGSFAGVFLDYDATKYGARVLAMGVGVALRP